MKRLKKYIKEKGLLIVSSDLGYSTPNTIKRWIKTNEIPNCAKEKLEKLMRKYEDNPRQN